MFVQKLAIHFRSSRFHWSIKALIVCYVIFTGFMLVNSFKNYKKLVDKAPAIFDPVDKMPIKVHSFLENEYVAKTPADAILIHPITVIPILKGKTIVYYEYFLKNQPISNDQTVIDFLIEQLKAGRHVYIQETYECQLIPYRCDKIKDIFDFIPYTKISPKNAFEIKEVILRKDKR